MWGFYTMQKDINKKNNKSSTLIGKLLTNSDRI